MAGKTVSSAATARVIATAPTAALAPNATPPTPAPTPTLAQTSGVARALAASPPVDTDRVATIKKAIAEGRFPILPTTIADRLLAFKLRWHPDGSSPDPMTREPGHDPA